MRNNLDERIKDKLNERASRRKWYQRITSIVLSLTMVLSFITPLDMWDFIKTGFALSSSDWIETAVKSSDEIKGAQDFGSAISDIKFAYGDEELDSLNAGANTSMNITMHLNYSEMSGSNISADQRFIYYQLDIKKNNITVENAFEGSECELTDGKWTGSIAKNDGYVCGYYSIAENGFIAIKLTENYIKDRIKGNNFEGDLYFEGSIGRADSASGDQEIVINGHKLTVEFDDMLKEGSKTSEIKKDDDGNLVVHYVVTINNKDQCTTLSNYKLMDTKFSGKVENLKTTPSDIGSLSGGAFEFTETPKADTIVVEYDYYPTSAEVNSGKLDNTATLQNKTKSDDKVSVTKETTLPDSLFKSSVTKTGEPEYMREGADGELGKTGEIYWEIDVSRDYNQSLKNYVIEDEAFKLFANDAYAEITSVKNVETGAALSAGDSGYTIDTETGKMKINAECHNIKIIYKTKVDNDKNPLETQVGATVRNEVKVYPPDDPTPESSDTEEVNYSEKSGVTKKIVGDSKKQIYGYENVPLTNTYPLEWNVSITDFHSFVGKTYTDTLQNGTVDGKTIQHTLTDDQFNAISIDGLTKGTDYVIDRTGSGFTITFQDTDAVKALKRKVSFNYESTVEAKNLENGKSVEIKNKGSYDGENSEIGYTIERENPEINGETFGFNYFKTWEKDDISIRPETTLKLQRRADVEGAEWETIDTITIDAGHSSGYLMNLLKSQAKTLEHPVPATYYYRLYEDTVPEGYVASYIKRYKNNEVVDIDTGFSSEDGDVGFEVINTYTLINVGVNKTWKWDKTSNEESTVRPDKVTFTLYKSTDQNTWEKVKSVPVDVDKNGNTTSYVFTGLPKEENGTPLYYQVKEEPVAGYTSSSDEAIISESNSTKETADFTNTYDKMVITGIKKWVDDEGAEDSRYDVTVCLESTTDPSNESSWQPVDDYTVKEQTIKAEQTLKAVHDWKYSWNELPRKTEDGKDLYYRVVEKENPTNDEYDVSYDSYADNTQYNQNQVITNTWKYVNITPKKNWAGDEGKTHDDIQVVLKYRRTNASEEWIDSDWTIVADQEIRTISSGQETGATWKKLPKTDADGNTYHYRAEEVEVPAGYLENYEEDGITYTGESEITNTYNSIKITPEKIWSGDDNNKDKRTPVTFKLQRSTDKKSWTDVENRDPITIDPMDDNTWTSPTGWDDLPKTEGAERTPIYYQIVELPSEDGPSVFDNYTPSESTNSNETGTVRITNLYNFIDISANKNWQNDTQDDRADVTVHLEQSTDGVEWNPVPDSSETITIDKTKNQQDLKTWHNLPKRTDDGKVIQYKVVETPVKGYAISLNPSQPVTLNTATVTITNTKLPEISKVALKPESNNVNDSPDTVFSPEMKYYPISDLNSLPVKTVEINGEPTECYLFKWKINVKGQKADIIDELPENSVFYSDTVEVYGNPAWGYRFAIKYENQGTQYQLRNNEVDGYVTYPYEGNPSLVRINIGNGGVEYVSYFTAIPKQIVDAAVAGGTSYTMTNNIVHNGTDVGDSADFTIGDPPHVDKVIDKVYDNQGKKDKTLVQAMYTVRINEGADKLSSDDWLNITDIFEVVGYAPGRTEVENGKTKYYTEEMVYGSGLLDAVIDAESFEVVDLNDLDANGNPKPVDFQMTTDGKPKTTIIKTYKFEDKSVTGYDWNEWRTAYSENETITITLKGNNLETVKASDVKIRFKAGNGDGYDTKSATLRDYIADEYLKPNSDGEYTFTIPGFASPDPHNPMIGLSVCGNDTFMKVTGVSAVQQETTTKNYLRIQVPDEKYLQITYKYDLKVNANTPANSKGIKPAIGEKPPYGAKAVFKNEASVATSDGTEKSEAVQDEFIVEKSRGGITTNSPPSIKKVNIGNHKIDDIEATFKLARWTGTKWEYATSFTPNKNNGDTIGYSNVYESDGGIIPTTGTLPADLVVNGSHELNLEANVLYKIVEISNPKDYVNCPYVAGETNVNSEEMKDFVFYFVYNGENVEYQNVVGDDTKIDLIPINSTLSAPNAKLIKVSVTKNWMTSPGSDAKSTFELFYTTEPPTDSKIPASNKLHPASDINSDIKPKTLSSDKNETADWNNIPNGYNGEAIYYYAVETSYELNGKTYYRQADGNYLTKDATPEAGPFQGLYSNNGLNKDGTVICTNSKGLSVSKVWKNADNSIMDPPDENNTITFKLQGKNSAGKWEDIELDAAHCTISGNGSVNIPPELLENYDDFQVIEDPECIPDGYTVKYTKNITGSTGIIEISNKNTVVDKINFVVKKNWNDGKSEHDDIEVTLWQSPKPWAESCAPTSEELSKSTLLYTQNIGAPDWTYTWENLDNMQSDGTSKYYYYAVESIPDSYTASYKISENILTQMETITNTPEVIDGELSVQKKWDKVAATDIPEKIEIQLYRRGIEVSDENSLEKNVDGIPDELTDDEKVGEPISLNEAGEWKYTFTSLEQGYSENGVTYEWVYYVKEITESDKWEVSYLHNGQNANGQITITIQNTGDQEAEKTSLTVNKVWSQSTHPDSVELTLQKKGLGSWSDVETITLPQSGKWEYTWTNLEADLYYKVVEKTVPNGWEVSYSDNNGSMLKVLEDGEDIPVYTVTNTLETGSLNIQKAWLDSDNGSTSQVQVELYRQAFDADGNPVNEEDSPSSSGAAPLSLARGRALVSVSRIKRALAESDSSSVQPQAIAPMALPKQPTKVTLNPFGASMRKATDENGDLYEPLVVNMSANATQNFDLPDLTDKEITSVKAKFTGDTTNGFEYYIHFYDGDSENWNGSPEKTLHISDLSSNLDFEFTGNPEKYEHVRISCYYNNSSSVLAEIRFYYKPTGPSITIDNAPTGIPTVVSGDTVKLNATPSDGAAVSWSSNNAAATVDSNGNVQFQAVESETEVTITATATDNGQSATADVTYKVVPFRINGNDTSSTERRTVTEGDALGLLETNAASGVKWSSSNAGIISVDENTGALTINANSGDAAITATRTYDGTKTVTDTIYYSVQSKGIILNAPSEIVHSGSEMQLTAKLDSNDVTDSVNWNVTSGSAEINNGKLKVDEDAAEGSEIVVTAERGTSKKELKFTVRKMKIQYNADAITELTLKKSIESAEPITLINSIGSVTGESGNDAIAYYDAANRKLVTGTVEGTTDITLSDEYGGEVIVHVTVEMKKADPEQPTTATKLTGLTGMDGNGYITISESDGWISETITGLPKTDGKGNVYKYYIREVTSDATELLYIPISYNVNGKALENDATLTLKLTNAVREQEPVELPETGGTGTKPYTAAGIAIMLLSGTTTLYFKRRSRRERKHA